MTKQIFITKYIFSLLYYRYSNEIFYFVARIKLLIPLERG